ncbi:hypothetical protein [Caballeronia sp. KNU42]
MLLLPGASSRRRATNTSGGVQLLGFARRLRTAKQQLNEAALFFNYLSIFQLTGLMARSEDEERLYRFMRGRP